MKELADWLLAQGPDLKGFSGSNLWRIKQFYRGVPGRFKSRTTGATFAMDA